MHFSGKRKIFVCGLHSNIRESGVPMSWFFAGCYVVGAPEFLIFVLVFSEHSV